MPYDDEYDNYYERMSETTEEFRERQHKLIRRADVNYEKYTLPFFNKWTVQCYGSGQQDSFIRNAVTGSRYDIKVGSAYQDLLFKVVHSTGLRERIDPLVLYYDSPEQYEKHHYGLRNVSEKTKRLWNERHLEAQKRAGILYN